MLIKIIINRLKIISHDLRRQNLPFILFFTLAIYIISSLLFTYFERDHIFNSKNLIDSFWWSIVTMTTVGYGDISPETLGGRITAVFTMVLGIGFLGVLLGGMVSIVVENRQKELNGMKELNLNAHIILCGWHKLKMENFIMELRCETIYKKTDIVIVTDKIETHPFLDYDHVHFVKGLPSHLETLKMANVENCKNVIIFADSEDPRSDDTTLLTLLLIDEINPDIYTVAELIDQSKRRFFEKTNCDEIIPVSRFSVNLMVQATQDPGTSIVLDELISNTYGQQLYKRALSKEFAGKSFEQLHQSFYQNNKIVIAVEQDHSIHINPARDFPLKSEDFIFFISARGK